MQSLTARLFIFLLAMSAAAECFAADSSRGHELARRWCSVCHLISADQPLTFSFAPTFADIAERPLTTRDLATRLLAPHKQMPDRALSRSEAEDIAAYIKTLRKERSGSIANDGAVTR